MAAQSKLTRNQFSQTSNKSTGAALNTSDVLNMVTEAFVGLHQVISGYGQEGEGLNEIAEDNLNGEQEAHSVPLTNTDTDTEAKGCATNSAALSELLATQLTIATDCDSDAVMADSTASGSMPDALNLGAIKEASKGISDNMLGNYQSLIRQCKMWLKDHKLIGPDETFFRANPHKDSLDMISAWTCVIQSN
ncbi:hypothetical protein Moror_9513 [Moniliophthora roreri MCA 2997]|uniref:Uncharacterized protein n=1 Tax=Moniliophthora roreri (strain MCA 2997) TaxID=1381753 RepID=V2XMH7_MONRO|nr:hypothetical protein Moror_9513 [Moniliophthora roreri MCA 2997]